MRKVLYVIDTLVIGGAEKSILAIASNLRNFKPVVCSLFGEGVLADEYRKSGIEVILLRQSKRAGNLHCARLLSKVIADHQPDIIHATLFRAEIASRLALWYSEKRVLIGSLVGDTYNPDRYAELSFPARVKLRTLQAFDAFTSRRVDYFVAISDFLRQSYADKLGIAKDKVVVIPRGRKIIANNVSMSSSVQDTFTFLSVGRLVKLKGHEELIRAFALLHAQFPAAKLQIAGEGAERKNLERIIAEFSLDGCVTLLGMRNDVPALLNDSDVFVFPSHYEGQGGALVEAMLASKVIIATDLAVIREAIDDGETGLLFPLKDVRLLSERMKWTITNFEQALSMGIKARAKAEVRYDIDATVDAHEKLYEQCLGLK